MHDEDLVDFVVELRTHLLTDLKLLLLVPLGHRQDRLNLDILPCHLRRLNTFLSLLELLGQIILRKPIAAVRDIEHLLILLHLGIKRNPVLLCLHWGRLGHMLRLVAASAPAFFLRLLGTVVTFEIVAVVVILIVRLFALKRGTAQLLSVVGPGAS